MSVYKSWAALGGAEQCNTEQVSTTIKVSRNVTDDVLSNVCEHPKGVNLTPVEQHTLILEEQKKEIDIFSLFSDLFCHSLCSAAYNI